MQTRNVVRSQALFAQVKQLTTVSAMNSPKKWLASRRSKLYTYVRVRQVIPQRRSPLHWNGSFWMCRSLTVWKQSPRVQKRAAARTLRSARCPTCGARSATLTAAAAAEASHPPDLERRRAWRHPAQPAWPGLWGRGTSRQVWPYVSRRRRRTRDARPFQTAMSSQRICRTRRYLTQWGWLEDGE